MDGAPGLDLDGLRKSGRAPKPKWEDSWLREDQVPTQAFHASYKRRKNKRATRGEGQRPRKARGAARGGVGEQGEYGGEDAQPWGDDDGEQGSGEEEEAGAAGFKDRPGAWDGRMRSSLSALLSRLLCSRRALEAAWRAAPGVSTQVALYAVQVVPVLAPDVRHVCRSLDLCAYPSMSAMLLDVSAAIEAAAAAAVAKAEAGHDRLSAAARGLEPPSQRLLADAAWLNDAVHASLRTLEHGLAVGSISLPEFVRTNAEPYLQTAQWTVQPYKRRPYVRLTDYQMRAPTTPALPVASALTRGAPPLPPLHVITDGLGPEVEDIAAKMSVSVPTTPGCDGTCCQQLSQLGTFSLLTGRFGGQCPCLNTNHECGPACGCGGTCANTAVSQRRTLQLGVQVAERDVWGMDCYTRRNVHEAAKEAHMLDDAPEGAMTQWIEQLLLPAMNRAGPQGWDLKAALKDIHAKAREAGDRWSCRIAAAVAARVSRVGRAFFRAHPKGCGIICIAPGGLPAQTFVEEYFGEVHPPWRWFEKQDALKRRRRGDLPDFYNMLLDRPKDEAGGFDVIFVDAAPAGSFASRLCHSCTPNCQAVVMSAGGRLTIAVYTLRWIAPGEELTFDYSSVTESDAEFRAAICLCGTTRCRGSFLYYAGSSAFQQVMTRKHTFLDRNALLVRAGTEPLTEEDKARLEDWGLRSCALGGAPDWLVKWTALVLGYIDAEKRELPAELCALPRFPYSPEAAAQQACGLAATRLQNVAITLDKVKHFLRQPGQPLGPPLRLLTDTETAELLWTAPDSVARRLADAACAVLCAPCRNAGLPGGAHDTPGCAALARLRALCDVHPDEPVNAQAASRRLLAMASILRSLDTSKPGGGRHAAAADLAHLYAKTRHFYRVERYNTVISPTVTLRLEEVGWTEGAIPNNDWHLTPPPKAANGAANGNGTANGNGNGDFYSQGYSQGADGAPSPPESQPVAGDDMAPPPEEARPQTPPPALAPAAAEAAALGVEAEAFTGDDEDWWVTDARTAISWNMTGSGSLFPVQPQPGGEQGAAAEGCSTPRGSGDAIPPPADLPLSPLSGMPARRLIEAVHEAKATAAAAGGAAAMAVDAPGRGSEPGPAAAPSSSQPCGEEGAPSPAPVVDAVTARVLAESAPVKAAPHAALLEAKKYRPLFVWGQLIGWFKQTVLDPTSSMSAERRGTVCLPDMECCYGKYGKDRAAHLGQLLTAPGLVWPANTTWTYKSAAYYVGSPMLDAAIARSQGEEPQLNAIVQELLDA